MRLTTKTDYCLRVLIYLQENPGKTKIRKIADTYKISKNHLNVAVNKLSELKYIHSTPGPKGGIEFNSEVGDRTIADLMKSLEDLDLVECFNSKTNNCVLTSRCRLKHMLKKAAQSFLAELSNYKIKELV